MWDFGCNFCCNSLQFFSSKAVALNRTCKRGVISVRFHGYLQNPANFHEFAICSKTLRYHGDKSHSNRR